MYLIIYTFAADMKLPSTYMAALVIASLVAVFGYQVYWLTRLYGTMREQMEVNITEALHTADYDEMMWRVDSLRRIGNIHGNIDVSAGYDLENRLGIVHSSTEVQDSDRQKKRASLYVINNYSTPGKYTYDDEQKRGTWEPWQGRWRSADSNVVEGDREDEEPLHERPAPRKLAIYLQQGFHAAVDVLSQPNFLRMDSLLTAKLQTLGVHEPHRLLVLKRGELVTFIEGADPDSLLRVLGPELYRQVLDTMKNVRREAMTDTLASAVTGNFNASKPLQELYMEFDASSLTSYCLQLPPLQSIVLRQMAGILTMSLIILVLLCFSFYYIIRVLLRQRTLEEMKTDFTNNITHELKTPIAVAYAANDALLNFGRDVDPEQRRHYLSICQQQLTQLSGLVEQILALSMERRSNFILQREEVVLTALLTPLLEQQRLKAGKPVRFSIDIDPKDLTVYADRTHLSGILSNLIDNAVKYSEDKADISITCRTTDDGQSTEIIVADHGIGIPERALPHIFDRFYRVPKGNRHDVKGYGLGLYYVKTMVDRHGWHISAESHLGEGSRFTIALCKKNIHSHPSD